MVDQDLKSGNHGSGIAYATANINASKTSLKMISTGGSSVSNGRIRPEKNAASKNLQAEILQR